MDSSGILKYYRIVSNGNKQSWIRNLAYLLLGFSFSGEITFLQMLLCVVAVFAVFCFAYAYNDKEDAFVLGEESSVPSSPQSGVYLFFPLLLSFLICFVSSITSKISFLLFLSITFFYSCRHFRLKDHCGWLYSPVCACLLVVIGLSLQTRPSFLQFGLLINIFVFHLFAEMVHVLSDLQKNEKASLSKGRALLWLRLLPFISMLLSFGLSFFEPVFIIGALFSGWRIFCVGKVSDDTDYSKVHANTFSSIYAVYEFLIYGILGMFMFGIVT